jgi:uncharacterized protein YdcH (DUF465 family)
MELVDRLLVERFVPENQELRELVHAHKQHEDDISALSTRSWLSQGDQQELRILKKHKLRGRDRIEEILRGYRSQIDHT